MLEDASIGEDTPAKSGGVRRERVKRVKGEGSLVQRSDSVKQINKRRLDTNSENIQQRHVTSTLYCTGNIYFQCEAKML